MLENLEVIVCACACVRMFSMCFSE